MPGTEVAVEIRDQPVKAVVVSTPFYKRQKKQA
jgi:glycine cleavage system aminomethyltransferase T